MPESRLTLLQEWKALADCARTMSQPENHLKHLVAQPGRLQAFSRNGGGLFVDFSRQRLDGQAFERLLKLAEARDVMGQFGRMTRGDHVNVTENRAALHTACRNFSDAPVYNDGRDVMPEIRRVREGIRDFAAAVHSGKITGANGKRFTDVVVIGIGGSYLGAEFAAAAMAHKADKGIRLHFLANVDIDNFGAIAARIKPETTLWVVISKTYTTAETTANTVQALGFITRHHLSPKDFMVTVTSKGSPGDDPNNPVLRTFHMFDYIGGRYSVTSAVGGVPLSLYLGYDRFEEFLKGAEEMDNHAAATPARDNLPLLAALISVWNSNFLGYPAQGLIP